MDRRKFFRSLAVAPVAAKLIALDKLVAEDVIADGIIDLHQMARYMTQRIAKAMNIIGIDGGETGDIHFAQPSLGKDYLIMDIQKYWAVNVDCINPSSLKTAADSSSRMIARNMEGVGVKAVTIPDGVQRIDDPVRFCEIIRGLAVFGR